MFWKNNFRRKVFESILLELDNFIILSNNRSKDFDIF